MTTLIIDSRTRGGEGIGENLCVYIGLFLFVVMEQLKPERNYCRSPGSSSLGFIFEKPLLVRQVYELQMFRAGFLHKVFYVSWAMKYLGGRAGLGRARLP